MVKILDCTTRDGGHCLNWNFSKDFIFDLMACQNNSKISFYEIGYRNHFDNQDKGIFYKCTPSLLKEFYSKKGSLKLGVMTDTKRFSLDDFPNAKDDYIDFVRIACRPDRIEETLNISQELYNRGYSVLLQLMDFSNVSEAEYSILESWENKELFETVYIADTYGTISSEELELYFNKLKSIGYNRVSFHGHNTSGLAFENTLKAIELGAYSVDITLDGIGRGGGNLDAVKFLDGMDGFTSEYYKKLSQILAVS